MAADSPEEICRLFQYYMAQADLDGLIELYDTDAVLCNRAGECKRGEGLKQELAPFAAAKAAFSYKIMQLIEADDIALMNTEWKVSSPQSLSMYAIEVARRQADGTWRWLIGDPFTMLR